MDFGAAGTFVIIPLPITWADSAEGGRLIVLPEFKTRLCSSVTGKDSPSTALAAAAKCTAGSSLSAGIWRDLVTY